MAATWHFITFLPPNSGGYHPLEKFSFLTLRFFSAPWTWSSLPINNYPSNQPVKLVITRWKKTDIVNHYLKNFLWFLVKAWWWKIQNLLDKNHIQPKFTGDLDWSATHLWFLFSDQETRWQTAEPFQKIQSLPSEDNPQERSSLGKFLFIDDEDEEDDASL